MAADFELRTTFFITAVAVSARLSAVLKEAKNISLEAMNAKALVARAGENVRTFKPITDYMVELANDTINLVEDINREALLISRSSLTALRGNEAVNHFNRAKIKSAGALYSDSYEFASQEAEKDLQQFQHDLLKNTRRLHELLEEIESRMLAANVVTSTSRLEAATVSTVYRANFEAIVGKFESAAKNIRSTVRECRKVLNVR
ncbi:putative Methyl-accepting chemotaxis protein [Candidatus Terasakiella magnetica]|uniref:Putative Methyl-accepting chemotaxis protein n=1 Tax=Candidatus Terasakiella magnetica TaxID=1867952 RepID=A0A1C3RC68_9PROT|nr:hypothetical protein [Candidatus Terasakiella magnetica]SCA54861.1 putative Methyl-accepting chemotaxis protein [Candidatus Terasakiella magnetica]